MRVSQSKDESPPEKFTLTEDDRRLIGFRAADCTERVLPLFLAKAPTAPVPAEAIECIWGYS